MLASLERLCGAATPRYAASDHSLGETAVFPWIPSVKVQSFAPPPQRLLVKILTRDVTRCLDDTHISNKRSYKSP